MVSRLGEIDLALQLESFKQCSVRRIKILINATVRILSEGGILIVLLAMDVLIAYALDCLGH